MSSSTPNKTNSLLFPNQRNKSQEKSLIASENEAVKPMDNSGFSAKKPIKRLRAWCGDCYQFFEFGPFAKVCQQHVIKKNCNVFECKKKLINPSLSKKCIRKFANINSENRHTYCVDEAEMRSWDPRLKIQNSLLPGESSKINFSSTEKNRKNSFDSIKFSDLNLDLMENSELFFDNFSSVINNNNNNNEKNNSNLCSASNGTSGFNGSFREKNKLNINLNGSSYLNKKVNKASLKDTGKAKNRNFGSEIHLLKSETQNQGAFAFRSPGNYRESDEYSPSNKARKVKVLPTKENNSNRNNSDASYNSFSFEDENQNIIKQIGIEAAGNNRNCGPSLIGKNGEFDYKKSKNRLKVKEYLNQNSFEGEEFKKGFKKRNILRKQGKFNRNITEKLAKLQSISNSNHTQNQLSIKTNSTKSSKPYDNVNQAASKDKENCIKEDSKEGIVNVNGLIDQIGNLKFENSKNDSILEDEILIKQFDNIYFNYNKNRTECEIISLNDSNLELISAKNVRIEDDFDFLNNSNHNFNLNSNHPNGSFNEIYHKSSDFAVFKSQVNSATKKYEEGNKMIFLDLPVSKIDGKNNDNIFMKQKTDCDLSLNLIGLGDNSAKRIIKDNKEDDLGVNKNNVNIPIPCDDGAKVQNSISSALENSSHYNLNDPQNVFKDIKEGEEEYTDANLKLPNEAEDRKNSFNVKLAENAQSEYSLLNVGDAIYLPAKNNLITKFDTNDDRKIHKITDRKQLTSNDPQQDNSSINPFAFDNRNFQISSNCNLQVNNFTKQINSQIPDKDREHLVLTINKSIEFNLLPVFSKNKSFDDSNLKQEKIENLAFEPLKPNSVLDLKNKIYKISDDAHLDEIMLLVHDNTGIPGKVLSKLKDAMKKKGIFNARMLRLFKKKKAKLEFHQKRL